MAAFKLQGIGPKIAACERIIGYRFANNRHVLEAINMSSQPIQHQADELITVPKNTRLAVYGDAAADFNLCTRWIGTSLSKDQWSLMRRDVLGNFNLARVGFQKRLDGCINLNPGTSAVSAAMMATTVEAILGAVHQDGGDEALRAVMDRLGLAHDLLAGAESASSP